MKLVKEHINEVLKFQTWTKENPYKGDIDLDDKDLNSLPNNIPKFINGDFYCRNNKLTTLEFAPEYVGGSFYCYDNYIPKEEIEKYWKTGAVKGYIYGEYIKYKPYKKLMNL